MLEELTDVKRSHTLNPIYDNPTPQQHYLGKVVECLDEQASENDRSYKIKFNILGLPEFASEWPVATLLGGSTRPVRVDEIVKIWDICDSSTGLHLFYYEPIFEDHFTGIKNWDNKIDLTQRNYVEIKLPGATITFDRSGGNKEGQGEVPDQGTIKIEDSHGSKIELSNTSITINAASSIIVNNSQSVGFSCIPKCPYAGIPHIINVLPAT